MQSWDGGSVQKVVVKERKKRYLEYWKERKREREGGGLVVVGLYEKQRREST